MSRILVVRLDSMGDVLLSGPAVRAIATGGSEVWMLCGPQGKDAAHLLPGVRGVLVWDCPWISDPAPAATATVIEELGALVRELAPERAVILTSFHQSPLPLALLLRLNGVQHITGASTDYAGSLLDVRLKPGEDFPEDMPEPERARAIAAAAGFRLSPEDDGRLRLSSWGDASAVLGREPYVVLHPGASAPARTWPAEHFAATAQLLASAGVRVVVTGSAAERGLTARVAGLVGADLGGRLSLPMLAGVLARASAVIVGNTGPAHLAAAVGTPVVSLFSPVVPAARWAPYGVPHELLGDQHAACAGSRARQCPVPGHPCLADVSPEQVVQAYARVMERAGRAVRGPRAMQEEVPA